MHTHLSFTGDVTVTERNGHIIVRDEDGVVAIKRESGEWIDAFGGVFTAADIEALDEMVAVTL